LLIQSHHFVASLCQRDAGLEPRDADECVMNVLGQIISILADGHPKVGPAQKTKVCRQHARYRIPLVVQRDGSPDHRGIAPKPALPKAMAQNHHRGTARSILFRNEEVAGRKVYPQHGKQSRACVAPQHPLWLAFAGQIESLRELYVRAHLREAGVLLAPVRVVARRQCAARYLRGIGIPDLH